ncbi:MAG TPA: 16S rRNA (guanine(527)-N(7))-methyltransferase RsmG [Candidatus Bathyarchaeia archaeon]|nr:16S rRNA (guanine(527)-N(7))-methyltransferase RsmG [Candidatus Bathyarchaeia archaeon]
MTTSAAQVPTKQAIERASNEFKLALNEAQVEQIQQYTKILGTWNDKVNLTAIRDPLEILYRHFCESMFGSTLLPVENCRLADVGSGGGFPGIPLKIIRPDLHVFLVESNVKKATFLAEVIRELGLRDTRVLVSRFEELGEEVAPLDVVCSRALGDFAHFLAWAASPRVAAHQVLLWLGGRDLDEVRAQPSWNWSEPLSVPKSLQRFLLLGTRIE